MPRRSETQESATSPRFDELLASVRKKVGRPRRLMFRLRHRALLRPPPTNWSEDDPEADWSAVDRALKQLESRTVSMGTVVWGQFVRANRLLWERGSDSWSGATVLYSLGHPSGGDPVELARAARRIFELKGTSPEDPVALRLAQCMDDDSDHAYGLDVPRAMVPSAPHRVSSIHLFRCRLPRGFLARSLLPVFAHPAPPYWVTPVPFQFWPTELLEYWDAGTRRAAD